MKKFTNILNSFKVKVSGPYKVDMLNKRKQYAQQLNKVHNNPNASRVDKAKLTRSLNAYKKSQAEFDTYRQGRERFNANLAKSAAITAGIITAGDVANKYARNEKRETELYYDSLKEDK